MVAVVKTGPTEWDRDVQVRLGTFKDKKSQEEIGRHYDRQEAQEQAAAWREKNLIYAVVEKRKGETRSYEVRRVPRDARKRIEVDGETWILRKTHEDHGKALAEASRLAAKAGTAVCQPPASREKKEECVEDLSALFRAIER